MKLNNDRCGNDLINIMVMATAKKSWILKFLYLCGFLDNTGVSIVIGIMIKSIRNHGISPSYIGLMGSIYGTVQIFSGPIIGKLSDLHGRKIFLILSYIMPALGYVIIGTSSSLFLIVISRIINGKLEIGQCRAGGIILALRDNLISARGIFKQGQLCCKAYLTELTPSTEHSTVLGHINAASSVGFIIGPLIGGQIAELDPTLKLPFIVAATIFIINATLIFLFIPATSGQVVNKNKAPMSLNFKALFSEFNIFTFHDFYTHRDILLFRFVSALSVITFRRNLPILLEDMYHVNAYSIIGAIMSFNSVIGVIASSLSGRISKLYSSSKKLITHMTILMCVAIVTAAWSPWLPLTIACMVPLSLATANLRIASVNFMLSRGEGHKRGALIGIGTSVSSLARALSPTLVGVAQETSSQVSGIMSGVLSIISVGLTLLLSK